MLGNTVLQRNLAIANEIAEAFKKEGVVPLSLTEVEAAAERKGNFKPAHRRFLEDKENLDKQAKGKKNIFGFLSEENERHYMGEVARLVKKHKLTTCNTACQWVISYLEHRNSNIPAAMIGFVNYDHVFIVLGLPPEKQETDSLEEKDFGESIKSMVIVDLCNCKNPFYPAVKFSEVMVPLLQKENLKNNKAKSASLDVQMVYYRNPSWALLESKKVSRRNKILDNLIITLVAFLSLCFFGRATAKQPSFFSTIEDSSKTIGAALSFIVLLYFGKRTSNLQASQPVTIEEDTSSAAPRKTM